jgi:hypothetical protein
MHSAEDLLPGHISLNQGVGAPHLWVLLQLAMHAARGLAEKGAKSEDQYPIFATYVCKFDRCPKRARLKESKGSQALLGNDQYLVHS